MLATQNPIEQEGTYPLPEAQLDRFMFNIVVGYPSRDEELEIMKQTTAAKRPELEPILTGEKILQLQEVVRQVVVADHVFQLRRRPGARDAAARSRGRRSSCPSWSPGARGRARASI